MPILVNDFHAGRFIERLEMIEFTYISGKKQIYCVGKEGERCHCFRLESNNDIIKVRRYSADYPFDLIDTQGAKHSKDCFFQQVSLDKKTKGITYLTPHPYPDILFFLTKARRTPRTTRISQFLRDLCAL